MEFVELVVVVLVYVVYFNKKFMLVFKKKERKRKKLTWGLETRLEPLNDRRSTHSLHIVLDTSRWCWWVLDVVVGVPS